VISRSAVKSSYVVIVPCKDGEATIRQTLQSLLEQTIPPETVIVIDDASTDETPEILKEFSTVCTIRLNHNLPRDFTRVPKLINLGLNQIVAPCGYVMISGDDCVFPARYVELLLSEFEHDFSLLIVSGSHMKQKILEQASPHGAGRIIVYDFLRTILPFPESIGWESWVLFKALQRGGRIKRTPEVFFQHLRPYSSGSIRTFGQSMYELGYPFWFVVARVLKDSVSGSDRLQRVHMLRGYLEYLFKHKPRLDIADFVAEYQTQRIRDLIAKSLFG